MSRTAIAVLLSSLALAAVARDLANDPPPKPADPLSTPEGRFAHSIRIPNPVSAESGYRRGMSSKEYFDHLCRTEAGEFVFKTVENVDGIVVLRQRPDATDQLLMDRNALEDPYGAVLGFMGKVQDYFVQPASGERYEFMEIPSPGSDPLERHGKFVRYYRDSTKSDPRKVRQTYVDGKLREIPYTVVENAVDQRKGRFGYTWRGIVRAEQREHAIAGGELIVLDLSTNQVLAVRRGYIRSGDAGSTRTRIWWLGGHLCPNVPNTRDHQFVKRVLRPRS